ncbi:MAG: hypothetical protein HY808_08015 [Nitrospirae bacterium]|nr:hypothetical protein [Nitrospirota bacterium]
MKVPVVKEWGSWAVFFSSVLAGLISGLLTKPWLTGRESGSKTALTVLGLTLLINSKNPLTSALRAKEKREHILWFSFFALTGFALLVPFLIEGLKTFLVFSLLIASYAILLSSGKEHHIVTELNGFALLTIAAPVVYFAMTGEMSWKLYLAVTMFFAAGVFKVRVRIRKTPFFRWLMIFHCAAAVSVFYLLDISTLLLLPLIENIATAVWLREEKLRTTGNIELTKAIIFIVLMGFFWR